PVELGERRRGGRLRLGRARVCAGDLGLRLAGPLGGEALLAGGLADLTLALGDRLLQRAARRGDRGAGVAEQAAQDRLARVRAGVEGGEAVVASDQACLGRVEVGAVGPAAVGLV